MNLTKNSALQFIVLMGIVSPFADLTYEPEFWVKQEQLLALFQV